jgi:hypothetical protein
MRANIMCLRHDVGLLMQHLQGAKKLLLMLRKSCAIQNQLFEGSQTLATMGYNMGTWLQQLEELVAQCVTLMGLRTSCGSRHTNNGHSLSVMHCNASS